MARLCVGLTGGIGSGKSTVAEIFQRLGVPVFDADEIARELVEPNAPAWQEIIDAFGRQILLPSGRLDRIKLRRLVFSDSGKRRQLEAILHPRILARLRQLAESCPAPYCLLVIPLLVETGAFDLIDRVLVVDCPEELQRKRLRWRGLEDEEISAIIAAQAARHERLRHADELIDNSGTLEALERQVRALHEFYSDLAKR